MAWGKHPIAMAFVKCYCRAMPNINQGLTSKVLADKPTRISGFLERAVNPFMRWRRLTAWRMSGGLFCLATAALPCLGQTSSPSGPIGDSAPPGNYAVTQAGPHSRVWQNSAGQSVTEISTGMNFWSEQGWTPSDPSFQLSADGTAFVANRIQDPTTISCQLNTMGAVTAVTPQNVTLSSSPIALGKIGGDRRCHQLYRRAAGRSGRPVSKRVCRRRIFRQRALFPARYGLVPTEHHIYRL